MEVDKALDEIIATGEVKHYKQKYLDLLNSFYEENNVSATDDSFEGLEARFRALYRYLKPLEYDGNRFVGIPNPGTSILNYLVCSVINLEHSFMQIEAKGDFITE